MCCVRVGLCLRDVFTGSFNLHFTFYPHWNLIFSQADGERCISFWSLLRLWDQRSCFKQIGYDDCWVRRNGCCFEIFLNPNRWWFQSFLVFVPSWGDDPNWREYSSIGLKPTTSVSAADLSKLVVIAHESRLQCLVPRNRPIAAQCETCTKVLTSNLVKSPTVRPEMNLHTFGGFLNIGKKLMQ